MRIPVLLRRKVTILNQIHRSVQHKIKCYREVFGSVAYYLVIGGFFFSITVTS